jgi:hypothetical protein
MLLQDAANLLDTNMLDAVAAVPGVRPAGLLNGIVVGTGAVGGGPAAVMADLKTLMAALYAAGVGAKPVLIVNTASRLNLELMVDGLGHFIWEEELSRGRLKVCDIIDSPLVPAATAIMVDAAYFASAFDPPEIDYSEEASITMANADATAPTQAGAAVGGGALGTARQVIPDGGIPVAGASGASTTGYTAMSLWQSWSYGIRQVWPCTWGLSRAGAVATLNGLTW